MSPGIAIQAHHALPDDTHVRRAGYDAPAPAPAPAPACAQESAGADDSAMDVHPDGDAGLTLGPASGVLTRIKKQRATHLQLPCLPPARPN